MSKKINVPQNKMLLRLLTDGMLKKDWLNAIAQHYNVSYKTAQRWTSRRGFVDDKKIVYQKLSSTAADDDTALFNDADVVYRIKLFIAVKQNGLLIGDGKSYIKQRKASMYELRVLQESFCNSIYQFMLNDYLKEKPIDEIDLLNELITDSKHVVILVFPGYINDFDRLLNICTDYNNLLSLSTEHYLQYKN